MALPRIFALVVAVDRYKTQRPNFENLTGCKNDGERLIKYLRDVLKVPASRIRFLADEEATEEEILRQFRQFLIQNKDIQRNDTIIFFFAGHGSSITAPEGWLTEGGKMEALCPHDIWTRTSENDEPGRWGIPDRTMEALMCELASSKGDNIIAVYDCCFSGGLGRNSSLPVRYAQPPPYRPPANLHQEIWSSVPELARASKIGIQNGRQYKSMASHVLLAACRPDEGARENPFAKDGPGGLFTAALLDRLGRCRLYDTSYASLFEMLDLGNPHQHPQCEGTNKNRVLFGVNTLRDGRTRFKLFENKGMLFVHAGSIHGIVRGTQFTLETATGTFVLRAKGVRSFATKLEGNYHDISNDARAYVSHWGHSLLKVHSPLHHASSHCVTVVDANKHADVALCRNGSGWHLKRFDPLIPAYSDPVICFDADGGRTTDILDAAAKFNSLLYRSNGAATDFGEKVKIRISRLGSSGAGFDGPVGDDLLQSRFSSHSEPMSLKEVTITDLGAQYCITLENYSDVGLFPYFFCLDPLGYGIEEWYVPEWSTMQAPLRQNNGQPSLFALGYGAFGTNPIEFFLPDGRKTDSCFLKVFLTTQYVDMSSLSQPSINDSAEAPQVPSSSRGESQVPVLGEWACDTFVLTCRGS